MNERAPLDAELVRAAIRARVSGHAAPVVVHATTGSTNDDARALAREGAAHGTLVLAEQQTRGRGRSGNPWFSPPGENLYASLLLTPQSITPATAAFSLVVGLCVAQVVERACAGRVRAQVKWPNDVLVADRKIAGVLIEGSASARGASLVVGVGLNVGTRAFPPELGGVATSIAEELGFASDRNPLAADLAVVILEAWPAFEAAGLAPHAEELARRDALRGRRVRVDEVSGVAAGIEPDGRLLIEGEGGVTTRVVAGHVELLAPLTAGPA